MPYMWTIVHPINSDSPLFGLTNENLVTTGAEFIVSMKAFDESPLKVYTQGLLTKPKKLNGAKSLFTQSTDKTTVLPLM